MFSHRTTYRVIYGDTDNMGQAYYGNYFRWFEIGRSEMFRSLGLSYKAVEDNGIFLPVSEAHCKYARPAKYDDVLVIETSLDPKIKAGLQVRLQNLPGRWENAIGQRLYQTPMHQPGREGRAPSWLLSIRLSQKLLRDQN